MEKQIKNTEQNQRICSKIYACFEEPETLKFMNFLDHNQNKLIFKGLNQETGRRNKQFNFDGISFLTDKLKHIYADQVKQISQGLLKGQSRSAIIYGSDESKKQKILIGESQNPGLLLMVLTELFQSCYDKQYEDKVTIKLSCWQHRDGELSDVFGATSDKKLGMNGNWVSDDLIEGKVVVGVPEIIIRNMKSALKIIKLYMKKVEQTREQKEEETQSLIFTIKVQIDNAYDKQGNVVQYKLAKFHLVKLANPYVSKTISKHPQWFISLFNFLQTEALEKAHRPEQQNSCQDNDLSLYLRECVIKSVEDVLSFTCFSNKMTSNQCLTALKFNSYLQHFKMQPSAFKIDLLDLKEQQFVLQNQLIKAQDQQKKWLKGEQSNYQLQSIQNKKDLQQLAKNNIKVMQLANYMQYQFANVLTSACDKLQKYIFNEEVQDYFYAKKINIIQTQQLKEALNRFFVMKKEIIDIQNRLIRRVNTTITKLKKQGENRQLKYALNSKTKEKQILQKLFYIYNTMSAHFIYEENDVFTAFLQKYHQNIRKEEVKTIAANSEPYESTYFSNYLQQKQNKAQLPVNQSRQPAKKKRSVDQMEMMFTNSNASLCGRKLKNN